MAIPAWQLGIGVIAVGAVAALIIALQHVQTPIQQFVTSIDKAVSAASNLTVLNTIAQGMTQTTQKLNDAATQGGKALGDNLGGGARTGAAGLNYAHNAVNALTGEQQKLFNQNMNVIQGAGAISKAYGGNFTGALALADLAGVKLANTQVVMGKNANAAGVQIQGLIDGYAAMDQTGGILANSMDAVNVQIGLQDSKVQQSEPGLGPVHPDGHRADRGVREPAG